MECLECQKEKCTKCGKEISVALPCGGSSTVSLGCAVIQCTHNYTPRYALNNYWSNYWTYLGMFCAYCGRSNQ